VTFSPAVQSLTKPSTSTIIVFVFLVFQLQTFTLYEAHVVALVFTTVVSNMTKLRRGEGIR